MSNTIISQFISEFNTEVPATRKCLERIPERLFDWKPHEKSMTLGYLSLLVAEIPMWITEMIKTREINFQKWGTNSDQLPLIENISSTLNHWVHHRGQLIVYMRLNNIAVPSIYGPSADEKTF
ncbi:DinB family protein [Flavihumibacter sp. ZG627]|uniref:DinB family protein n=1 Tax=Flavihumibacter sp. ZG627 TaxID=1463156 RepID=UPI00057CBE47|nr:DinB family protein [Flavihumibacter sp. ZG627]KIC91058.1 hypothetical protein HY58_08595 [Flavihumibacter sp. ZG627]